MLNHENEQNKAKLCSPCDRDPDLLPCLILTQVGLAVWMGYTRVAWEGQGMVAKMLVRPEGGLSHWWGSWQGSPSVAMLHQYSPYIPCRLREVLLAIPDCCSWKVGITQHSPQQWLGSLLKARHSPAVPPSQARLV